jgi:molybdopterin-guanine dinucleotide biosynthesis protein A
MGTNKALLPFRGRPLISRQIEILAGVVDEVLIGANEAAPYRDFPARVVPDVLPERCALAGIHAIIAAARHPAVFVTACDLPFLNADLVRLLLSRAGEADVVLPFSSRGPEPLHAVYARSCLPAIERSAAQGDWKATAFHRDVRVLEVQVRESEWLVEARSPFFNANTPGEWEAAAKSG